MEILLSQVRSDRSNHTPTGWARDRVQEGQLIHGPDPTFCNTKLAIARALHVSGTADIIAETYGSDDDEDAIVTQPVYLGGPFVSDDILYRRLNDRLSSYA